MRLSEAILLGSTVGTPLRQEPLVSLAKMQDAPSVWQ